MWVFTSSSISYKGQYWIKSFTDIAIDERTESEVSESKFKTEVEEKVQNNKVELESFTDVDFD